MIRGVIALGRSVIVRLVSVCPIAVLVQVESRAECVTVSGERDGPHVVVVRGLAQRYAECAEQFAVEGILPFGPIQPEHAKSPIGLNFEHLGHGRRLCRPDPLGEASLHASVKGRSLLNPRW